MKTQSSWQICQPMPPGVAGAKPDFMRVTANLPPLPPLFKKVVEYVIKSVNSKQVATVASPFKGCLD
jgi:hypothetical protein